MRRRQGKLNQSFRQLVSIQHENGVCVCVCAKEENQKENFSSSANEDVCVSLQSILLFFVVYLFGFFSLNIEHMARAMHIILKTT